MWHSENGIIFASENNETRITDVMIHPTCKINDRKGKKIMKRIVNRILDNKKFNKYCVNVLKMYNYGRVNTPV